jgi:transcriptional regulatory protein RtcR
MLIHSYKIIALCLNLAVTKRRPFVVIGILGTTLDRGRDASRWEHWRPSVDLCRHDDLIVDRFELLYEPNATPLAQLVAGDIVSVSPETEVRTHKVTIADSWDFEQVYGALHDFASGYPFAPDEEDYVVHVTTGTHVIQICLFLLTESRHLPARLIQTSPPRMRDHDSLGRYAIIDLDLSKYDRLATRFHQEQREGLSFLKSGIDTRSARFNQLIERIEQVAIASRAPLLLMGPTGAGKSRLARRIYELKKARRQVTGPFVELNCATLRGDAAMSALFGHRKGAFTGALQDRPGLLRTADKGMLFLDEIGELGPDEQAMLLRALEHQAFLPLGADREVHSEFQLIAGTNRDLPAAVRQGRFREDLLARINLWTFRLPGLAQRTEDIAPNLEYELAEYARLAGTRITFSKEARDRFLSFAVSPAARWQGNFRDFNGALVRMATLAQGGRITLDLVNEEIDRLTHLWADPDDGEDDATGGGSRSLVTRALGVQRTAQLDRFDRVQLEEVLRVCCTARTLSDAGRLLFSVSRTAKRSSNDADRLRKYLARFDLDWTQITALSR